MFLRIPFNFEINPGTIYQVNFTNELSSKSAVLVIYYPVPKDQVIDQFLSSNLQPNNENAYLIEPGEVLVLSYEKQICDSDTYTVRAADINLVNGTSAFVDVLVKVTKDTGECSGDGFISFPFIPAIFTIWILAVIINKKK